MALILFVCVLFFFLFQVLTNQIFIVSFTFSPLAGNYFGYNAVKKQLLGSAARGLLPVHTPAVLISEETTAVATEDQQRSSCCIQTFTAAEL